MSLRALSTRPPRLRAASIVKMSAQPHVSAAHHRNAAAHHSSLAVAGGGAAGSASTRAFGMVRRASVHTPALNEDMESMSEEQLLLEWGRQEARRCDDGDPDLELCELPEIRNTAPVERNALDEAWSRGRWLLGLLLLQSLSSFVLDSYQQLLKDHLVVTLFLTMLVGAGGNAGNQSAIKVIRGLATGSIEPTRPVVIRVMQQQAAVGLLLGAGLSAGGFARVLLTTHSVTNSLAISISLFLIVICSVLAGTGLPFALTRAGIDPANAGTSIQVFMDVLGVVITCATCHLVLDQLQAGLDAAATASAALS